MTFPTLLQAPVNGRAIPYLGAVGVVFRACTADDLRPLRAELAPALRCSRGRYVLSADVRRPGAPVKLWVHAPTDAVLRILKADGRCELDAATAALDILPGASSVEEIAEHTHRHLHMPSMLRARRTTTWRDLLIQRRGFGPTPRRGREGRTDRPGVEVALRMSAVSLTGRRCVQVQFRMAGAKCLQDYAGIASLSDLLAMDHQRLWTRRVHMLVPPSREALVEMHAQYMAFGSPKRIAPVSAPAVERACAEASLDIALRTHKIDYDRAAGADVLWMLYEDYGLVGPRPENRFLVESVGWLLPRRRYDALRGGAGEELPLRRVTRRKAAQGAC